MNTTFLFRKILSREVSTNTVVPLVPLMVQFKSLRFFLFASIILTFWIYVYFYTSIYDKSFFHHRLHPFFKNFHHRICPHFMRLNFYRNVMQSNNYIVTSRQIGSATSFQICYRIIPEIEIFGTKPTNGYRIIQ